MEIGDVSHQDPSMLCYLILKIQTLLEALEEPHGHQDLQATGFHTAILQSFG